MKDKKLQSLVDAIVFAMLGTVMFISKVLMEALPNIHFVGMLTMVYTLVYRKKALIPIYVFVLLNGIYAGFSPWWIPYLYIWTVLWAVTMILPKFNSEKISVPVYALICAFHGLFFGVLYAPAQALVFGLDFKSAVAWVIAGIPFDCLHAAGNFAAGLLIVPLTGWLKKIHKNEITK